MKDKSIRWGIVLILGMVGASAMNVNLVAAETTTNANSGLQASMTISPMNQRMILSPGESYTGAIKVTNPVSSTRDLVYRAFVGSFSQRADAKSIDDYGTMDFETKTSYNEMMKWITLSNEVGEVAPNSTELVTFTVTVPENAPAGGQYATIIIRDESDDASGGNESVNIKSNVQMASIIYAEVVGKTIEEGKILQNEVPAFLMQDDLKTTAMVENTGNVHTDAEFVLQVWPMGSNEEICTNQEEPTTELILPETKKYYVGNCRLPGVGMYQVKQMVRIFDTETTIERTIFYCPIWLLAGILFGIIMIVIIIITIIIKRRKKKMAV